MKANDTIISNTTKTGQSNTLDPNDGTDPETQCCPSQTDDMSVMSEPLIPLIKPTAMACASGGTLKGGTWDATKDGTHPIKTTDKSQSAPRNDNVNLEPGLTGADTINLPVPNKANVHEVESEVILNSHQSTVLVPMTSLMQHTGSFRPPRDDRSNIMRDQQRATNQTDKLNETKNIPFHDDQGKIAASVGFLNSNHKPPCDIHQDRDSVKSHDSDETQDPRQSNVSKSTPALKPMAFRSLGTPLTITKRQFTTPATSVNTKLDHTNKSGEDFLGPAKTIPAIEFDDGSTVCSPMSNLGRNITTIVQKLSNVQDAPPPDDKGEKQGCPKAEPAMPLSQISTKSSKDNPSSQDSRVSKKGQKRSNTTPVKEDIEGMI